MRLIFNIILVVVAVVLAWVLFKGIQEPIAFNNALTIREQAVIDKLRTIRRVQEMYRDITGEFAPSFDTLVRVLETEDFSLISVIGDPDDPNFQGTITYDTTLTPAIDSIRKLGINLDSLKYVPYTNGDTFNISADVIEYQATTVPVVEVGIPRKQFMGKYASPFYKRYENNYDPNKPLKFGDLNAPNLSGNWE